MAMLVQTAAELCIGLLPPAGSSRGLSDSSLPAEPQSFGCLFIVAQSLGIHSASVYVTHADCIIASEMLCRLPDLQQKCEVGGPRRMWEVPLDARLFSSRQQLNYRRTHCPRCDTVLLSSYVPQSLNDGVIQDPYAFGLSVWCRRAVTAMIYHHMVVSKRFDNGNKSTTWLAKGIVDCYELKMVATLMPVMLISSTAPRALLRRPSRHDPDTSHLSQVNQNQDLKEGWRLLMPFCSKPSLRKQYSKVHPRFHRR
ncbi:hypothetical protein C7974DRAFT_373460 [Boeremia exigua]|uniref:uncharacterized protein n=1 Tax=Boeremia exigua TaxID=749465 RepID=UPI001E8EC90C|nr:uncharacterized protein C7974DRAFT_373460 [Boeremia exigua]KAH6639198.1 hypothetical protein C7974DRAFT_373460 [Boeremia exigua]